MKHALKEWAEKWEGRKETKPATNNQDNDEVFEV